MTALRSLRKKFISSISSQLNVATRGPELITIMNILVASFSIPYMAYYMYAEAYFSAGVLVFSIFVITPFIQKLVNRKQYDKARFLLPASLCFITLLGTQMGIQLEVGIEHYFVSAAIVPFVVFDLRDSKKILVCLLYPVLAWLLMIFLPAGLVPDSLLIPDHHVTALKVANIWGSYIATLAFLGMFHLSSLHYESVTAQQNKMASLGEMASGIAHEINNPLSIIVLNAGLVSEDINNPQAPVDEMRLRINTITETAQRIAKIVSSLSAFARSGDNDPLQPITVSQLIEEALAICSDRLQKKNIHLYVVCPPHIVISCRPSQLSQVLINLINNSFDAIKNLPEPWIHIEVESHSERVQIRVTDSGSGIEPSTAERIMEPFFTTKGVGEGTGLGLSISKGLVEANNGTLYLDKSNKNTRFVIDVPLADSETAKRLFGRTG